MTNSSNNPSKYFFSARTLSIESKSMLLNLSLVMKFLRTVFTKCIFEKLLSHETLVMVELELSVSSCMNNQTQICKVLYKWKKLFERCRDLRLLPKQILCQRCSCFKSFSLIEYAFTNFSSVLMINTFDLLEKPEKTAPESLQTRDAASSSYRRGQFSWNFIRWRHRAYSTVVQLFRKR